jgi:SAM-dependent methyltransferase
VRPSATADGRAPRAAGETYEATRRAWERVWREEADLARELATLEYPRARRARSLYLPHLPADDRVLEAGCGLGIEVIELARLGYRVVGVDYVEGALHRVHRHDAGHRLVAGDVHALPLRGGSFGAYLSFGVLEHFEFGPEPGLREANRVLRAGGVLVLTVPYPSLVWRLGRLKARLVGASQADRGYETAYTVRRLEHALQRTGFDVLERHPISHDFTLWGCGRAFRGSGYYETSPLAERLGGLLARVLPWPTCFASLVIARKARAAPGAAGAVGS